MWIRVAHFTDMSDSGEDQVMREPSPAPQKVVEENKGGEAAVQGRKGIPTAPFVADVESFLDGRDAPTAIQTLEERYHLDAWLD